MATTPLAAGRLAPDFTLDTDEGVPLTLSSLRGRPVVLYFYPRDDTATCTRQACGFRDALPRLERLDAVVLGVSTDPVRSHARFRAKYDLPFTLLADVEHRVAERYGVWGEKRLYGRAYMGILRTTFVIDARGRIARVFERVKVDGHAAEVAEALAALATVAPGGRPAARGTGPAPRSRRPRGARPDDGR